MARDLNKVMLIGRLGGDPELRYTPQGTPVANVRLAVNRRTRGQEGQEPREGPTGSRSWRGSGSARSWAST